jgi:aryl-phospho-beta-D-glucosidase BglC (GH1 family)
LLLLLVLTGCNNGYAPWVDPDPVENATSGADPMYKGHNLPRLRGVNVFDYEMRQSYLDTLASWNVNHIRWWVTFPNVNTENVNSYLGRIYTELAILNTWLLKFKDAGIYISILLETAPGGNVSGEVVKRAEYQDAFVAAWDTIAGFVARHPGKKAVYGYDLANEPHAYDFLVAPGLLAWQPLCRKAGKAIRVKDPETAIIFPNVAGNPFDFETFDPGDLPGVVYTQHMYHPYDFTHQAILGGGTPPPMTYPNENFNKEVLREYLLKDIGQFGRKNNIQFNMGEFGAVRWADGAGRYIRDVIEIFEEFGYDWAFFAYSDGHAGAHMTLFGCTYIGGGPDQSVPGHEGTYQPGNVHPIAKELRRWFKLNKH